MNNDVEHITTCLLAIYISPLEKFPFRSFVLLKIGPLVFLLFTTLSCDSSLYILDTSFLSDIWFANIFSHSVGCLFTFMMVLAVHFCGACP